MGDRDDDQFPRDDQGDPDRSEGDKKRLFERVVPELIKRVLEKALESGVSKITEGPENIRNFLQELKLPKEALQYIYNQIDDTKNGLYRVVAKELRDVLEHTHFGDELTRALTKLSFEIRTEIRFVPNDAAVKGDRGAGQRPGEAEQGGATTPDTGATRLPKPEVTASVSVKDRSKDARR